MSRDRKCRLSLFTWTTVESEAQTEIVPFCHTHASSKVRVGHFGTGVIVTCHEERNHLVKLCERDRFDAEKEEATRILLPAKVAGVS